MTHENLSVSAHNNLWDEFPADDYHWQYKKRIQEDEEVIDAQVAMAGNIGIAPYSIEGEFVEIGNGGVFQYPVVQRFMTDKSTVYYTDYSPTGCISAQNTLNRFRETGGTGIWGQFGDYLVSNHPEFAAGPNNEAIHPTERAMHLGKVAQLDAADLPEGAFAGAISNFCLDSKNRSQAVWEHDTERFVRCVRPGGFIAVVASLESSGYEVIRSDGEIVQLPAIAKTAGQMADRFRDLGVQRLRTAVIDYVDKGIRPELPEGSDDEPTHYSGMGVFMGIVS